MCSKTNIQRKITGNGNIVENENHEEGKIILINDFKTERK